MWSGHLDNLGVVLAIPKELLPHWQFQVVPALKAVMGPLHERAKAAHPSAAKCKDNENKLAESALPLVPSSLPFVRHGF